MVVKVCHKDIRVLYILTSDIWCVKNKYYSVSKSGLEWGIRCFPTILW